MKKYLLVIDIDLDSTGLGYTQAIKTLNLSLNWYRGELGLVYASSLSYAAALASARQRHLLEPDFWVTANGTEIYDRSGMLVQPWTEHLSQHWPRHAVAVFMEEEFPSLVLQPAEAQNPWQLSYALKPLRSPRVVQSLRYRLARSGLNAKVLFNNFNNHHEVNILPRSAGISKATDFLRRALNVRSANTVVCGGSTNDIELFQLPVCGVIMGNAQPELQNWYHQHHHLYHYLAQASHARGILEGLHHFNFLAELSSLIHKFTPDSYGHDDRACPIRLSIQE